MLLEGEIATKDVVDKLRNRELLAQMKPASDHFYDFCALLADRLENQEAVLPQGFAMSIELLIYDLSKGVDGFTNKPMNSRLVGLPSMVFALMKHALYRHLEMVLPVDFIKAVFAFEEEVKKSSKAG